MPHAHRGTKRRCSHCGAAFYDLDRTPVICPKCHAPHVETPRLPSRPGGRGRAEPVAAVEIAEPELAVFDEDEVLEREDREPDDLTEEESEEEDENRRD